MINGRRAVGGGSPRNSKRARRRRPRPNDRAGPRPNRGNGPAVQSIHGWVARRSSFQHSGNSVIPYSKARLEPSSRSQATKHQSRPLATTTVSSQDRYGRGAAPGSGTSKRIEKESTNEPVGTTDA